MPRISVQLFASNLSLLTSNATTHHYTTKSQASYLRNRKNNGVNIMLLDFAENYSFVFQDAIQGYH